MSMSNQSFSKNDGARFDADQDADVSSSQGVQLDAPAEAEPAPAPEQVNITGRAVFAVETTGAGVVVRTAFMTEDNRLLDMPAVFPDMVYAMNVVDDLKRQIIQHFSQAAQVGAQVIANQAQQQMEQQRSEQQGSEQQGKDDASVMVGSTQTPDPVTSKSE